MFSLGKQRLCQSQTLQRPNLLDFNLTNVQLKARLSSEFLVCFLLHRLRRETGKQNFQQQSMYRVPLCSSIPVCLREFHPNAYGCEISIVMHERDFVSLYKLNVSLAAFCLYQTQIFIAN